MPTPDILEIAGPGGGISAGTIRLNRRHWALAPDRPAGPARPARLPAPSLPRRQLFLHLRSCRPGSDAGHRHARGHASSHDARDLSRKLRPDHERAPRRCAARGPPVRPPDRSPSTPATKSRTSSSRSPSGSSWCAARSRPSGDPAAARIEIDTFSGLTVNYRPGAWARPPSSADCAPFPTSSTSSSTPT